MPYIFILRQDDNERALGDKLAEWGLAVRCERRCFIAGAAAHI